MVSMPEKIKLMRLFGGLMSNPAIITRDLKVEDFFIHNDGRITVEFLISGELAALVKEYEPHVQRALEKKAI